MIFQSTPSTWLPSSGKMVATPLPFPLPQKVRRYPSSLTFSTTEAAGQRYAIWSKFMLLP
ncbi:hypothetical protein EVA_13204 [gut metagenome]|uniref:Uncharacterized protein n=1 Tax=gut metagenome TaxID=749906 RepID=J9GH15_9ZZZZ